MPLVHRFGDFQLNPQERLLLRRGTEVALTARAFAVLCVLVERAGELVPRAELMQRVWGHVIVEDNNIAVHVAQLRKALGAEAISTLPGIGYRFALEIATLDSDASQEAADGGNLPLREPPLVGREAELAQLDALLQQAPLVVLCGPAGIGKTSLARAAARQARSRFADGAWWVDLSPIDDPEAVVPAIARVLGLKLPAGDPPLQALARRLRPLSTLVVLDNAEHVVQAVSDACATLVRETQGLVLLVTSQMPLAAASQKLVRLEPLSVPEADTAWAQARSFGALQLLSQRAADADCALEWDEATTRLAADVCRRLDGNALAIELAAARLPALGLARLSARLEQRLVLFQPGPPITASRRNALGAALEWSYGLLAEREQLAFRRLALFPGSFDLDRAVACIADERLPEAAALEALLNLVDRSLVSADRGAPSRHRLLDSARLHARDKLAQAGDAPEAALAFCRGWRFLMDEACEAYWLEPRADWRATWAPEADAVHAAIALAREHDLETAVALCGSAWPLWEALDMLVAARREAESVAARVDESIAPGLLARFWESLGHCHSRDYPVRSREASRRAAELYASLGDARHEYLAWVEYAFNWRVAAPDAWVALERAQSLEDPAWPAGVIARGRTALATMCTSAGRFDEARAAFKATRELCERAGHLETADRALLNLADVERAAGRADEAVRIGEELAPRLRRRGPACDEFLVLANLLGALIEAGRLARAHEVAALCAHRFRRTAEDNGIWSMLDGFGLLHALEGRPVTGARLAGASDRAYADHGQPQRQPNERADRARLDAVLAEALPPEAEQRCKAEGRALPLSDAVALAFEGLASK